MDVSVRHLETTPPRSRPVPTVAATTAHQSGASGLTNAQLARLAGVLYLILAVCGGFSELFVRAGARAADGLALLFLDLHRHGYLIAQIFFALWLLPLGYLVLRSGYFPRALGVLLMLGCAAYLADIVAIYSAPGFESHLSVYFGSVAGLAEVSFLLWLLVKGAREDQR
jgi:hypothetical protein